ncbi:MAG TPA: hypothetical protein VN915_16390 [Elusimicrobiota bacterium]|nr:hypothetical protein [Elusimicrobiota bacterium]
MKPTVMVNPDDAAALAKLFGLYRAEWLNGQLYELFTEPNYFPEFRTRKPCVLVGGRGTGKTTVLRGLSYQGQYALQGKKPEAIKSWPFYGIYYRVDTNRIAAFDGPELKPEAWRRCFAHYFNLVLSGHILEFLTWYGEMTGEQIKISEEGMKKICLSLNLPIAEALPSLVAELERARIAFEVAINNVGDGIPSGLSMQGAPIDAISTVLCENGVLHGKQLFFLIDEYENFSDAQQVVINTLIKHVKPYYTFKIGVKELGWRQRTTINATEQLTHPADYELINISEAFTEDKFREFATRVCNERIKRAPASLANLDVCTLFPELGEEEEARLLGLEEAGATLRTHVRKEGTSQDRRITEGISDAMLYFLDYWAKGHQEDFFATLRSYPSARTEWETRFGNYFHAALFSIRKGKRGIRKHYAGWSVLTRIASGNIRYVLELVHKSLLLHFEDQPRAGVSISPEDQTTAAQFVGKKSLTELEGLSDGRRLTRLLLGLGRIFEVMASESEGHAPEVNQFHVQDAPIDSRTSDAVNNLLKLGVTHQAFIRFSANKLADPTDTRAYDYMLHPIFAPFFVFSDRKKRKMTVSPAEIIGLVMNPRAAIEVVLKRSNRSADSPLPDQLKLFESFYIAN